MVLKLKPTDEDLNGAPTGTAVVAAPAGGGMAAYRGDAGAGLEDVDSSEMLIPFLRILQSNSPACEEGGAGQIEGARPGMVFNTATQQLIARDAGFGFVPAHRTHNYCEYIPRDSGGGFQGIWDVTDPRIPALRAAQGEFGKLTTEGGNELIETFSLYGVAEMAPDDVQNVVVAFTSTQIKKYRLLTTRMVGLCGVPRRYPLFAFKWHVSTRPEQNKKGKFHGWHLTLAGGASDTALLAPTSPLYLQARDFYYLLRSGAARANYEADAGGGGDGTGTDSGGSSQGSQGGDHGVQDGEIPF
jgi:hypothetical protein